MHSFSNTRNTSSSESSLESMNSLIHSLSSIQNQVPIRRTICTEEVIPSFVPIDTGFFNKISSPHRRKTYQRYKTIGNLSRPEEIESQVASLNLTDNQFNHRFSSFSYCSPVKAFAVNNSHLNQNLNMRKHRLDEEVNLNTEESPMEVDSFKDPEAVDLNITRNDLCSSNLPTGNILRLRNLRVQQFNTDKIKLEFDQPTEQTLTFKIILFTGFTLIILGIYFGLSMFLDTVDVDSKEFNLENLKHDLSKVFKQDNSVNIILESLKDRNSWSARTLIFFGSSGVGKTFVTNILKTNFPKEYVHEIDGRFLEDIDTQFKVLDNLKTDSLNLLIIDDVKKDNCSPNLVKLVKHIDSRVQVLIIAVVSTVEISDDFKKKINLENISKIKTELNKVNFKYDLVIFNDFSKEDVKQWIKNELISLKVPMELHENIVENVMRYNIQMSGLKELHSKIVLEIEHFV